MRPRALRIVLLLAPILACGSRGAASSGGADASVPDAPVQHACTLASAGAPMTLLTLDMRNVSAPQMVVLDPGSTSSAASIALQLFANAAVSGIPDDIEIARARVDRPWPAGAAIDKPPELLGEFALGYAQLAAGPSPGALAIGWHREEVGIGKPQFRAFDSMAWTASNVVELAATGDAVLSLVAGGDGYGVVWRDLNAPGVGPVQPFVALLDAHGAFVHAPYAAAGQSDFPGPTPSLAWIGGRFVIAMGFKACGFSDTTCVAHAVVTGTVGPSAIDRVAMIPALDPATAPGHVAAAAFDDRVWLAWSEGDPMNDKAPRTVRLVALDSRGVPTAAPITLVTAAPVTTAVSVAVSEIGVVVTWAEGGDADASQNAPGSSRVVVRRVGLDGVVAPPIAIDTSFVDTYGPPTSAALAAPRGALVLWAGRSAIVGNPDVAWLARFDCAEP